MSSCHPHSLKAPFTTRSLDLKKKKKKKKKKRITLKHCRTTVSNPTGCYGSRPDFDVTVGQCLVSCTNKACAHQHPLAIGIAYDVTSLGNCLSKWSTYPGAAFKSDPAVSYTYCFVGQFSAVLWRPARTYPGSDRDTDSLSISVVN